MVLGGCGVDIIEVVLVVLFVVQVLVYQIDCIVVVIGEIDYVINGQCMLSIFGGDLLMICIVGIGCVLLVVVVVSCVLLGVVLDNVVLVCCWMKLVGQVVVECSEGLGSFILVFFDVFYYLDVEVVNEEN